MQKNGAHITTETLKIVLREQNCVCRCWNHQNCGSRMHWCLHACYTTSQL